MSISVHDPYIVGISSSALFDTIEGSRIYDEQGLEAFISYQIANEGRLFAAGPAMPLVKALLQINTALTGTARVEVVVMSHNNPAAAVRTMKSIQAHNLGIKCAAIIGDGKIESYLKAYGVSLLLSRNPDDVRDALDQGVAAALLMDSPEHVEVYEGQLRIAFDGDSVLFSDYSERIHQQQGLKAFQAYELAHEKEPLPPGPFASVLWWVAQLQCDAAASGGKFSVRTAIVTARNEAAMSRVIHTMREWGVRIDETHFLGDRPKTKIVHAFRPHIFFDDQEHHILPASKLVPAGHVPYGIANETPMLAAVAESESVTVAPPVGTAASTTTNPESTEFLTRKDFETQCRAIFRRYTALSQKGRVLNERYRLFISEHGKRNGRDRAKIVHELERYDLGDLTTHDPILNRELGEIVRRKLDALVTKALAPKQSDLPLA
jgi:5'-nucleotidase